MAKEKKAKKKNTKIKSLLIILILVLVAAVAIEIALFLNSKKEKTITTAPAGNFLEIEKCFSEPWDKQNKCFEDFVEAYAGDQQIVEILAALESARKESTQIENTCHPIVHAIGRFAYEKYGNVGDAFQSCDLTCHSGCYHGVMERLFFGDKEIEQAQNHLTYDDLAVKIPGICDADKFKNFTHQLQFQCLHGVGHAIMYSLDYNLDDSLRACDLLETDYDRSSCYGGVIMENVTAFDKTKRDIKRDDPIYPCNRLDKKYQYQCYMMQTSLMKEYGMTVEEITDTCRAIGEYDYTCFTSLGRDLSNNVRTGNISSVVEACELYSKGFESFCIEGVLYALIDNTGDGQFGYKFCNALSESFTDDCYETSNDYLRGTFARPESVIYDNCNKYAGGNRSLCKSK